jgi:hypothetical protein
MVNTGDQDELTYGVPANDTLYIVLVNDGSRGYLQYYGLASGSPQIAWTQTGSFTKCDHQGHRTVPEADFEGCDNSYRPSGAMAVRRRFTDTTIDIAWISCSEGCCTSKPS